MNQRTLIIHNIPLFNQKLKTLNSRAKKFGLAPISYEMLGEVFERDEIFGEEIFLGYEIEVTYPYIRLSGEWTLIGVIDHRENLAKAVPGRAFPSKFLGAESVCDYCRKAVYRKETFIVEDAEGNHAQVGRNCLGAFLGIDAGNALRQASLIHEFDAMDDWSPRAAPAGYALLPFLSHVVKAIRIMGWTSGKTAQEEFRSSTASIAWDDLSEGIKARKASWRMDAREYAMRENPSDADIASARETIAWMQAINPNTDSDYKRNLWQIASNDFVTHSSKGYAASAYNAMRKEQEEAEEAKKAGILRGHVGKIGGKFEGDLILLRSLSFDGQWGTSFIHRFEDASGNVIIWKTGTPLTECRSYAVKASIKEHGEYKGIPQTIITRAKIEEHSFEQARAFDALRLQRA